MAGCPGRCSWCRRHAACIFVSDAQPVLATEAVHRCPPGRSDMLRLALVFLVIALIASLFSFGIIADFQFNLAKILFFLFLVLAVVAFIADAFQARAPV